MLAEALWFKQSPVRLHLRHHAHHTLMAAFLEPEIFDGAVMITRAPKASRQLRLVDDQSTDR